MNDGRWMINYEIKKQARIVLYWFTPPSQYTWLFQQLVSEQGFLLNNLTTGRKIQNESGRRIHQTWIPSVWWTKLCILEHQNEIVSTITGTRNMGNNEEWFHVSRGYGGTHRPNWEKKVCTKFKSHVCNSGRIDRNGLPKSHALQISKRNLG